MRHSVTAISSIACLCLAACAGAAPTSDRWLSDSSWTEAGTRVRITAPAVSKVPTVGWIKGWTPDTLFIEVDPARATASFPLPSIRRLETSEGMKGHAGTGTTVGLLIGTVVGFVIGRHIVNDASVFSDGGAYDAAIMTVGITAVLGGVVGGIIGSESKSERWKEVGD